MKTLRLELREDPPAVADVAAHEVPERLEALTDLLERETRYVIELRDALIRQRAAVASEDTAAVEATIETAARVQLLLEQARRLRTDRIAALAGDPQLPLQQLETVLAIPMPVRLEQAREALQHAAREVVREAGINREVLRRAIQAGEAFLQQLFSSTSGAPATYGEVPKPPPTHSGRVLDRRA